MNAERQFSSLATEKKPFWEYKLTSELVKQWIIPVERQWKDLNDGLYAPPRIYVAPSEFLVWVGTQLSSLESQVKALDKLINHQLTPSWGPPGLPGSVDEIRKICSYLADACSRILQWEETVSASKTEEPFTELLDLLPGIAGPNISEVAKISTFIDNLVRDDTQTGKHKFDVIVALPPGWQERYLEAMDRVKAQFGLQE